MDRKIKIVATVGASFLVLVALVVIIFSTSLSFGDGDTPGSEQDPLVTKGYVDSKTNYETVHILAGQSLIGGVGTEIILRSGEATAIDNGANGVSDLTIGADLMSGMSVGTNHLLLVPRDDGRGIYAQTEGYVMVRGEFKII